MKNIKDCNYTSSQYIALIFCRVLIGWHFLYEGIVKLMNPNWSAKAFLMDSNGLFKSLFFEMAQNKISLHLVDILNQWGLILIGLGLMIGLFSRLSSILGVVMLGLFYLSHPPIIGANYLLPSEGSYLIVNKNLIELASLVVIYLFPTSQTIGVDRFIFNRYR
ncbi:DoxX family membrane protein [Halosquirtibacter xylanolyticus]|uniref:DoxX family membrane protein n=1 Tax=Halosquirtibacter xylanolyticus TaxID=3374599 RepID=UPI003748C67E|nr:DoxX family membrane protein [Prolixibacteraceae bacterium]